MAYDRGHIERKLKDLGFKAPNETELYSIVTMLAKGDKDDDNHLLRNANRFTNISKAYALSAGPFDPAAIEQWVGVFDKMGADVDPAQLKSVLQSGAKPGTINNMRDFDRTAEITRGLQRNGISPNPDNVQAYLREFADKDVSPQYLDRRIALKNLGYDTSQMVDRTVDQTWDTKTAWEQANPGKTPTQANIQQYQPAASASGTKDVSVPQTSAKIGATQVLQGAAGGQPGTGQTPLGGGMLSTTQAPGAGNVGTGPGTATAGSGFQTGIGQTTGAVSSDYSKTALGNLNTFFPEFSTRQAELGKFASSLASDLNTGYIPDSLKRGLAENIRSAQGVRGLGASPLAAFDEAIGMSGAAQQYQGNQLALLGNTQNIMGAPLTAPGGYRDVAQLGQNLVGNAQNDTRLNQNQQQINLGAASDVLDRAEFTEGMDAERNKPKPSFWENMGYTFAGAVGGGIGGGIPGLIGGALNSGGGQSQQNTNIGYFEPSPTGYGDSLLPPRRNYGGVYY